MNHIQFGSHCSKYQRFYLCICVRICILFVAYLFSWRKLISPTIHYRCLMTKAIQLCTYCMPTHAYGESAFSIGWCLILAWPAPLSTSATPLLFMPLIWVFRWPIGSASPSHQCSAGSIPGWGSDPGAVSEKGLHLLSELVDLPVVSQPLLT